MRVMVTVPTDPDDPSIGSYLCELRRQVQDRIRAFGYTTLILFEAGDSLKVECNDPALAETVRQAVEQLAPLAKILGEKRYASDLVESAICALEHVADDSQLRIHVDRLLDARRFQAEVSRRHAEVVS